MANPLISVVVPNYNHARYLEQRLDTVFNQTYQNFEVIILDDNSTDNSLEVINRYKDNPHLSRIVVNEQNTGSPFKQWDKGINLSKGDLIWIAETDDYNELTFLEELITEWRKHKDVVVAFSNYVLFWEEKFLRCKERASQYFFGDNYIKFRMARGNYMMNASGVLFDRSVYDKIDKNFMNFRNAGDYLLWINILTYGSVLKINKNLTYYRHSNHSITSACASNGIAAFEIKTIFEYINIKIKLNWWQKRMAYASLLAYIKNIQYNTETIQKEVYDCWNESNYTWCPSQYLLWFIGALERHLGILI